MNNTFLKTFLCPICKIDIYIGNPEISDGTNFRLNYKRAHMKAHKRIKIKEEKINYYNSKVEELKKELNREIKFLLKFLQ